LIRGRLSNDKKKDIELEQEHILLHENKKITNKEQGTRNGELLNPPLRTHLEPVIGNIVPKMS
jgi:hypothetical protein